MLTSPSPARGELDAKPGPLSKEAGQEIDPLRGAFGKGSAAPEGTFGTAGWGRGRRRRIQVGHLREVDPGEVGWTWWLV